MLKKKSLVSYNRYRKIRLEDPPHLCHEYKGLTMNASADPMKGIMNLLTEIKRCQDADATISAVTMTYVCIDTMAFLSMPIEKTKQGKEEFIEWVDTYLSTDRSQSYQYRGIDVYAARCSLLHAFSAESEAHKKDTSVRLFGYSDNGQHAFNRAVSHRLVIISVAQLIHDLTQAIEKFIAAMLTDLDLRRRVDSRLPALYNDFPFAS